MTIFKSPSCPLQDFRRTHTSVLLLLVCVSVFMGVFVLYLCASVWLCMPVCHCDLVCDTSLCSPPPSSFFCLCLPHSPNPGIHRRKRLSWSQTCLLSRVFTRSHFVCLCAWVCVGLYVCVCVYYMCLIEIGGDTLSFIDTSLYCLCCLWNQLPIIQPLSSLTLCLM